MDGGHPARSLSQRVRIFFEMEKTVLTVASQLAELRDGDLLQGLLPWAADFHQQLFGPAPRADALEGLLATLHAVLVGFQHDLQGTGRCFFSANTLMRHHIPFSDDISDFRKSFEQKSKGVIRN